MVQTTRVLYFSFSLWYQSLERQKMKAPLAVSPGEDLSSISAQDLRKLAFKSVGLLRNWSSPKPQIRSKSFIQLGDHHSVICTPPGSGILLAASFSTASENRLGRHVCTFTCWDLLSMTQVPGDIIFRGLRPFRADHSFLQTPRGFIVPLIFYSPSKLKSSAEFSSAEFVRNFNQ
jgi:hypothetical protein